MNIGALLLDGSSLMFEAGGQPISGAPGFLPPIEKGMADLATNDVFHRCYFHA
jgi:hypothetical protein